jgi:hypothetical protein
MPDKKLAMAIPNRHIINNIFFKIMKIKNQFGEGGEKKRKKRNSKKSRSGILYSKDLVFFAK